jgi:hypothetical protein
MPIPDVPLRIVRKRYKLLYFVAYVAEGLLLRIVVPPNSPAPLLLIAGHLLFIVFVFVAVRSFRGRDEPIKAPRAPWRMTGTVRSAVILAVVFLLITASGVVDFVTPRHHPLSPENAISSLVTDLENLVLVILYINSAIRLHRSPDPVVPKPVTLAEPLTGLD